MTKARPASLPPVDEVQVRVRRPRDSGASQDGKRAQLLRRSVMDTAARLFAERGYGGTNLQDIAEAAGMSRPGLYYYFSSKEKLLEALVEEVTITSERQSTAIAARDDLEPEAALRMVVSAHARWMLEQGILFRVIDRSESELPPHLWERNQLAKRSLLENFTSIIGRGIDRGVFRPGDAKVAAFSIIGMCAWTAWWFKPEGRLSIVEIAETIADMAASALIGPYARDDRSDNAATVLNLLKQDIARLEYLTKK